MNFMTMLDILAERYIAQAGRCCDMILSNSGLMKKDLAKAMGLSPQSMASRLQSKADWTIDETCAPAYSKFSGVTHDVS